jgi:putative iron-dependent peroxidase
MPTSLQAIDAPLTRSAVFLVCRIAPGTASVDAVRDVLTDLDGLVKTVSFRDTGAGLWCTVGIGSEVWEALTGLPRPRELHPFREIRGATHTAVATAGDLLFHIRSGRQDLCFEFERLLLAAFGSAVVTVDEVSGFRYFDSRDLLGFVDGTADPVGDDLPPATLVGDEDPVFAGGSYVVVQRYLHPLESWNALSTEQQETIIGRRKLDGVELDDAVHGQKSHKTLATITDDDGEHDVLRDNMPFGRPGSAEFGTYFLCYSRYLWVVERMLERMFIGDPPGLHDRLLDFSVVQTGTTFFAPTAEMLAALGTGLQDAEQTAASPADALAAPEAHRAPFGTGSLGIGSLKTSTTERA